MFNPATGEQTGVLSLASKTDVDRAVEIASNAFEAWADTAPLRRARILNKFLRLVEDRTSELASAITREHGKVHADAVGEVQRGLEVIEFATGAPRIDRHSMLQHR